MRKTSVKKEREAAAAVPCAFFLSVLFFLFFSFLFFPLALHLALLEQSGLISKTNTSFVFGTYLIHRHSFPGQVILIQYITYYLFTYYITYYTYLLYIIILTYYTLLTYLLLIHYYKCYPAKDKRVLKEGKNLLQWINLL